MTRAEVLAAINAEMGVGEGDPALVSHFELHNPMVIARSDGKPSRTATVSVEPSDELPNENIYSVEFADI